jgi:hypothetical protein
MSRKTALRLVPPLSLAGLLVAVLALQGDAGAPSSPGTAIPGPSLAGKQVSPHFAVLSRSESNRCDLGAGELRTMADRMRLRGACCFPMDLHNYRLQLRELRFYRRTGLVPADRYDVSVRLAKRLLSLRSVRLSPVEQSVYERATRISELGGPCCCPCWRWEAFKGQASFLIARRDYSAARLAKLWESEEGCGGPAET